MTREPFVRTLRRNLGIALCIGAALGLRAGSLSLVWPFFLLALCVSLGGHYVELAFLVGVRRRLPSDRLLQLVARMLVWLVGGAVLFLAMALTSRALFSKPLPLQLWWLGPPAFVGIELVVHALLALRRLPNFYRGDG